MDLSEIKLQILRLLIFGLRVTVKAICDKVIWNMMFGEMKMFSRSVYHHNIWWYKIGLCKIDFNIILRECKSTLQLEKRWSSFGCFSQKQHIEIEIEMRVYLLYLYLILFVNNTDETSQHFNYIWKLIQAYYVIKLAY